MLGYFIGEQSPASRAYREALLQRFSNGALSLVTNVDGVLISHAGLSRAFAPDFAAVGCDPARLAQLINEEFRRALERQLSLGMTHPEPRTLDGHSPMWLRVDDADVGPERLLDGIEQIAGHTTPSVFHHWTEADFRAAGLYLIDPGSYGLDSRDHPRHYRYGVISGGRCRSRPAHPCGNSRQQVTGPVRALGHTGAAARSITSGSATGSRTQLAAASRLSRRAPPRRPATTVPGPSGGAASA